MNDVVARVNHILGGLGASADRIAEKLALERVKGKRNRACDCPIARYLGEKLGASHMVEVTRHHVKVNGQPIGTTMAVFDFVCNFDDEGAYPELAE